MADLQGLPPFADDDAVRVVVESPRGARVKLKYDRDAGAFEVGRLLPLGLAWPYDWGFVPGTEAEDGDPVDAMVLWDVASPPGTVVPCRLLGVIELEEDGEDGGRVRNDRLLAAPLADPRWEGVGGVDDLPAQQRAELERFFLDNVYFEDKHVVVLGWKGPEAARALVRRSTA